MAAYINDGDLGGEALEKAKTLHRHLLEMLDQQVAVSKQEEVLAIDDIISRGLEKKGAGKGQRGDKRKRDDVWPQQQPDGSWKTNCRPAGMKEVCGAFNNRKGCRTPCPAGKLHVCSVITGPGRICGKPNHGAYRHKHGRQGQRPLRWHAQRCEGAS